MLLLGAFIGPPKVRELFLSWQEMSADVGGAASRALGFAASPVFPFIVMSAGLVLAVLTSGRPVGTAVGDRVNRAGWFTFVALAAFLGSVVLFGWYIASSDIPATVRYVRQQTAERHLTPDSRDRLYGQLRPLADRLPPFQVAAARDAEAVQYAFALMDVFYAAGLRLLNGDRQSAWPMTVDLPTPSLRGIVLGVKDGAAPPPIAVSVADALRGAGISFSYVQFRGAADDYFLFIVGPR